MNNKKGHQKGSPNTNKLNADNSLSRYRLQDEFRAFALEHGVIIPDQMVTDGSLQYVGTVGKPTGTDGRYTYHDDSYPAGYVQNFRTNVCESWKADAGSAPRLSKAEWIEQQKERKRQANERAQAIAEKHKAAAVTATERFYKAVPVLPDHSYLVRKGIQPHNAKQMSDDLLITFHDVAGQPMTDQVITKAGRKMLLKGGKKSGAFCVIGAKLQALNTVDRVFMCEGWATGASIHEQYGVPVIVAIDAGNLIKVTEAIRIRWANLPIVIFADNDRKAEAEGRKNIGVESAKAVANQFLNVSVEVPIFPDDAPIEYSDFNDLITYRKALAGGEL